jgi:O-antigen/teichoic acid export membrane protein
MRGTRGIIHNLGILSLGQVAAQLLNVWALVFLADRLGAHWFGVVQVGVAFLAYALTTAEWGMFSLGVREIARLDAPGVVLRYARAHTGLAALQALLVVAVGLLVLPHIPFLDGDPWVFWLYLLAVVPQVFQFTWIAVGLERIPWVSATKTLHSLAYAALVLLLLEPLTAGTRVPAQRWVPVLFLAAMMVANAFIGLAVRRWLGHAVLPTATTWSEARRRWRAAAPLGGSAVVMRVLRNIDLIVLGVLVTPAMAGNYAAASRMIFLLVVAIEVLWNALLPRLSRLAAGDPAGLRRSFNLYLGFVVAGLLPVAVGGNLTGPALVDLLYGGEYAQAGPVFRVLAVSYSCLAVAMFLGNTLVATDRQAAYFPPLVGAAIVSVTATSLLVPRFGIVGAAWGMLASHATLAVALVFINRGLFDRRLGWLLLSLVPAVTLMGLAVATTAAWPVLLRIVLGAAVYTALAGFTLVRFRRGFRAAS